MFDSKDIGPNRYEIDEGNIYLIELIEVLEHIYHKAVYCKSDQYDNGLQIGVLSSLYVLLQLLAITPENERQMAAMYVIDNIFSMVGLDNTLYNCADAIINFIADERDFSSIDEFIQFLDEKSNFNSMPTSLQSAVVAYCTMYLDAVRKAYRRILDEESDSGGAS